MNEVLIRTVREADVRSCHQIESLCFEPSEAATLEKIRTRQQQYPEGFLVADIDGQVIGFINCGSTDKPDLADEAFKDMIGHDPMGKNLVIFSVAVMPENHKTGVSRKLMETFLDKAEYQDKESVLLLCKSNLVSYYEKFGFKNCGESQSEHGGFSWWEMRRDLN